MTRLEIIYRVVMTNYSTKCVVWPFAERYKGPLSGYHNSHIGKIVCEMITGIQRDTGSGRDKICVKYCHAAKCIRHVRWEPWNRVA
jgi:hypothetical protein